MLWGLPKIKPTLKIQISVPPLKTDILSFASLRPLTIANTGLYKDNKVIFVGPLNSYVCIIIKLFSVTVAHDNSLLR